MKRILVSDSLSPRGVEILQQAAGLQVDVKTGLDPEHLKQVIGDYDALVIRSATKVTADLIDAAPNLRVIGRAGIGVDNVDVPAATRRGIVVMNTPGGNTVTTAEHALALMVSLVRNIPQAAGSMKDGQWEKKKFQGRELCGKTLGVIGLGNVGAIVADRALGLKLKLIAYDPFVSPDRAAELGVELADLDELYRRSDIITVHVPLLDETRNLIDDDAFAQMKPGVHLVCAARGGIIDEDALLRALESGKVAGAALDVFAAEPPGLTPLVCHPQVICTPHLGASTVEAQQAVAIQVAEQIAAFLLDGTIHNALNMPSVAAEILQQLRPSIAMARSLGRLQSQLGIEGLYSVELQYCGRSASARTSLLTAAALEGLLSASLGERVNLVNAPLVARERGIRVVETTSANGEDYASLIRLRVETSRGTATLAGTLFGRKEPRVVEFDGIRIDAIPRGHLLIFRAHDRPGLVGSIATTLANHAINIGQMQFGRDAPDGRAVAVFNVDSEVGDTILDELAQLPHLVDTARVTL